MQAISLTTHTGSYVKIDKLTHFSIHAYQICVKLHFPYLIFCTNFWKFLFNIKLERK